MAISGITVQQLYHTPWGLPGHRGLFWLTILIASRWCLDRPATALRIAAASSCVILMADPAMGSHVLPYLAAGFLVDRAASTRFIAQHPWVMLVLAPVIHLVGLLSPFLHNLAFQSFGAVLGGMWFYIQGHLIWGVLAGFAGMGLGVPGRRLLRRLDRSDPGHSN